MRFLTFLISLLIIITIVSATPIQITTCQELQNIKNDLSVDYVLANDINCTGFDFGDGKGFMPIDSFTGNLNGQGNTISDLYINRGDRSYVGLFGNLKQAKTTIKNLGLIDANIIGITYVGGIAGQGQYLGIYNSYVKGNISGVSQVGGLVGLLNYGQITNSYAFGSVNRTSGSNLVFGGLVGYLNTYSNIYNSYSVVSVPFGNGLVGAVSGNGVISNSFYDRNVAGKNDVIGGAIPKTTGEMKDVSIYLNKWNLVDQWGFVQGDYPRLRWQKDIDFSDAHQPDARLKLDIAIVADTSGSMNAPWNTLCTKAGELKQSLENSNYDYRLTLYSMGSKKSCSDVVTNNYYITKYNLTLGAGGLTQDWPINGDLVIQEHDWRENSSARIMFLVGDNDGVFEGSGAYTPRCQAQVVSALSNNVIVNVLMGQSYGITANMLGAAAILTDGTGGIMEPYGTTNLLDLVEGIVSQQVQYFPEGSTDVGECQRGIRRMLPDSNWEIIREPILPTQELCDNGKDDDCDGIIDNVDICAGIVSIQTSPTQIFVGEDVNLIVESRSVDEEVVTCYDSLSNTTIISTTDGNGKDVVFNIGNFSEGLQQGSIKCDFNEYSFTKPYYFEVEPRGDVGVKGLRVSNSNPAVGENIKATLTIENYSENLFSNIEIDFIIGDSLFDEKNVVVTGEKIVSSLGAREIKEIDFEFTYNKTDWVEIKAVIDPERKIIFDSRENKVINKIIYVGLPDPTIVSGGIELTTTLSSMQRPLYGIGFNLSGNGEYLVNNSLNLPVAGALVEINVTGPVDGYFYTHTNNSGELAVYIPNPNVLGDYNVVTTIFDGTYLVYSYNTFKVVEPQVCTNDCYVPCTNCGNGGGPVGGGGTGGGNGGGWGGTNPTTPIVVCSGPDLFGRIDISPDDLFVKEDNNTFDVNYYIGGQNLPVGYNPNFVVKIFKNEILVQTIDINDFNGQWQQIYQSTETATNSDKFKMVIDAFNEVIECSEVNNLIIKRTIVEPRFKDISIDDILIPAQTIEQESNVFRVKVSNLGNVDVSDVNISFNNGDGVIETKLINLIRKKSTVYVNFNIHFEVMGEKVLIASTDFVDDDLLNNSFSKEFIVYSHDFFMTSVDQSGKINLIFSKNNPGIGETINVDALYTCANPLIKGVVPITLFVNGNQTQTKDFEFDCSKDNIARFDFAPQESEVYIMGVYVNYSRRVFEQNLGNNYATRALIVDDPQSFIVNNGSERILFNYDIVLELIAEGHVNGEVIISDVVDLGSGERFVLTNAFNSLNLKINENGTYRLVLTIYGEGISSKSFYGSEFNVVGVISDCFNITDNPIKICTLSDLDKVREKLDGNYILMNDIDASETKNWNDGKGWEPIGNGNGTVFVGMFNGNNHKISSLYSYRPETFSVGLFGAIESSTIFDLGLIDINMTGYDVIGGLVGTIKDSTVSNSYSTGTVNGNNSVGGLIGGSNYYYPSVINNSYSMGTIIGNSLVGGIIGFLSDSNVNSSYFIGTITGNTFVGGLIGLQEFSYVNNSYSNGTIDGDDVVGGLIGHSEDFSTVNNSYFTGLIKGETNVGGLIGQQWQSNTNNSYWDVNTSGLTTSTGGTGKTTLEMKNIATFVGWDFVDVWGINASYPYLLWEQN